MQLPNLTERCDNRPLEPRHGFSVAEGMLAREAVLVEKRKCNWER
jgi:hypothetical protein